MSNEVGAILEALLFASPEPVTLERLADVLDGVQKNIIRDHLKDIMLSYQQNRSGLAIIEVAGGYRMVTRPDLHHWVAKLAKSRPAKLSRPALETLAIIAYRQPITKAEVEAIRGVSIDGVLKTLGDRGLLRILGRRPEPGRPILYGTSKAFLEYFSLRSLSDLPSLEEFGAMTPSQPGEGSLLQEG
ncbi:MAG: SMC-Scp complex subunit ScpB [Candidatus Methylomirabilales bacterium]